jgi:hypothetical protein
VKAACFLAGLMLGGVTVHPAAAATFAPERCTSPSRLTQLGVPLPRVAARLARNETVTIVAIGSSSTAGAGASDQSHAYPAQLADQWPRLVGGAPVSIYNHGINGQDILQMSERLRSDAIDLKPDLVL